MRQSMLVVSVFFSMTISVVAEDKKLDWVQVTQKAGWRARDSQGELVYKDQLWIFGG